MSEKMLQCHYIDLHTKLNSDLHKVIVRRVIFRTIVPKESFFLSLVKFKFQDNVSKNLSQSCHNLENSLNSTNNGCISRSHFLKIKNYQFFCDYAFAKSIDVVFSYII